MQRGEDSVRGIFRGEILRWEYSVRGRFREGNIQSGIFREGNIAMNEFHVFG